MPVSSIARAIAGTILIVLTSMTALAENVSPQSLVGSRAPVFSLVSDQGRLVDYTSDYYGRYHLILTFFPAAFTPV